MAKNQICIFLIIIFCSSSHLTKPRFPKLSTQNKNFPSVLHLSGRGKSYFARDICFDVKKGYRDPFQSRDHRIRSPQSFAQFNDFDESVKHQKAITDLFERDSRVAFIRKVYGILGIQLFITLMAVFYFSMNKSMMKDFMLLGQTGSIILTTSLIGGLISMLLIQVQAGYHFLLLGFFTLFESIIVATISLMYKSSSVMAAITQSAIVASGLSLYAFQPNPKYDLSALGSVCMSLSLAVSSALLLMFLFGMGTNDVVVGGISSLLFSLFLIYDTRRICEGEHHRSFQSKQFVEAALTLYLDIINLFINLLRVFGEKEDR